MIRHGFRNTATYSSWIEMKQRCLNPNSKSFKHYGGRGINICIRWHEFDNFLFDMGVRPEGKTLDRINTNRGYSKSNCKWATPKEQQRNTRVNRVIFFKGESKCLTEWAEKYKLKPGTLAKRLNDGWPMSKAVSAPLNSTRSGVAHNQKLIEFNGKTQTLKKWAEEYGIKYPTLHKRISKYNMTLEQALLKG